MEWENAQPRQSASALSTADRSSKRERSQSASSSSGSDSAWSELNDDDWLNEPERRDDGRLDRFSRGQRERAVTPEKITSKTPLNDNNVGMKLLKLMGWSGGGLGAKGTGRTDPIPLPEKMDGLGLGKANIETRMLDEAIAKRTKVLMAHKIATETEQERLLREAKAASQAEVAAEISDTIAKFHCNICNKGYTNVAQWEEHLLSYGHNHAKRKREVAMQSKDAKNNAEEVNKRREKEKRREQMELERMLKAAGGKSSAFTSSGGSIGKIAATPTPGPLEAPQVPKPAEKRGGFFKVASVSASVAQHGDPRSGPPAPVPPTPATSMPPPPPSSAPQPPPPPGPSGESTRAAAPRFTQSASLAASFKPSHGEAVNGRSTSTEQSARASRWGPVQTLHPLLSGMPSASTITIRKPEEVRKSRNNFFEGDAVPSSKGSFEIATHASTVNTHRQPKGMQFVSAGGVQVSKGSSNIPNSQAAPATVAGSNRPLLSLASTAPAKKKPLAMDDDDEAHDELPLSLPTGRLKAQMPRGSQLGFGKVPR